MNITHIDEVLAACPVIPVVTLIDAELASPVADALIEGGITVVEVTIRTTAGYAAMERLSKRGDDLIVGAGTVWAPEQFDRCLDAGAQFVVSPGAPDALMNHVAGNPLWLPGAQTPTELARLHAAGFTCAKLYPADTAGGPAGLRALASVLPHLRLVPTGGVNAGNLAEYLCVPGVAAVAGSWITPSNCLAAGDWTTITNNARQALGEARDAGRSRSNAHGSDAP